MNYQITNFEEQTVYPHEICFGSYRRRCILRDGEPYLCVWTEEPPLWVEEDTVLFGEWLLIGTQEFVYGIRLDSLIKIEFPVNGYFKQFLIQENRVYVFDANGIFALDENLHILWQNRDLAVDGVLFKKMADADTMLVSCEMDPPGGWISRCLNIRNGEELLCSP